MKAYIAGPLFRKDARKILEKIDKLCRELKLNTYLPHRDMGVYKKGDSIPFFMKNRDMVDECDFMIAYLDWKGISSGTAWESTENGRALSGLAGSGRCGPRFPS